MKLFENSQRLLRQIERVADTICSELPDCAERTKALESLASAGAHALGAIAQSKFDAPPPAERYPLPIEAPTGADAELAKQELFAAEAPPAS